MEDLGENRKERESKSRQYSTTHGQCHSITYGSWRAMKARCYQPRHKKYPHYGGRGIKVCDRWKDSFVNFLADMGERPSSKHTIDRKDVNADYSPKNCRWLTIRKQRYTRRDSLFATIDGKTKPVAVWCRILSVPYARVRVRIKNGWTPEKSILTPSRYQTSDKSAFACQANEDSIQGSPALIVASHLLAQML